MGFEPSLWAWVLLNVVLFIAIVATAVSMVKKPTKFKGMTLLVLLVMFLILVSYKVLSFKNVRVVCETIGEILSRCGHLCDHSFNRAGRFYLL